MPEIKHNFAVGKMNKDVDERLVPKGEYRDALNIQVSTSEGSDVGTIQNILGNSAVVNNLGIDPGSKCVGAISDEKNDALYWFVREPSSAYNFTIARSRDIIFELKNGNVNHVFVDIKQLSIAVYSLQAPSSGNIIISSQEGFNAINVGDTFELWQNFYTGGGINVGGNDTYTVLSKSFSGSAYTINIGDYTNASWATTQIQAGDFQIVPTGNDGVLKFPEHTITGINIIDDMLFWTDGYYDSDGKLAGSEPKKINISRGIEGTDSTGDFHTKLIVNGVDKGLTKEKHVTVIKRAPKKGVSMGLTTSRDTNLNYSGVFTISDTNNLAQSSLWDQRNPLTVNPSYPYDLSTFTTQEGSNIVKIIVKSDLNGNTNFALDGWGVGTKVAIKEFDSNGNIPQIPINDYTIKGVITDWLWTNGNGVTADVNSFDSSGSWGVKLAIKISSISRTPLIALNGTLDYVIDLFDESEKLYEFKLPRFSYRYKYEDGEYSHFAPWTDVAFKPGSFDYHPKKGYNLGMTNTVQSVQLTDFITIDTPLDVVEIDILYKEEKSPNIYIVDTLKPNDHPTIPNNGVLSNNWNLNKYEISKENIMSILPSNQFLRPYDNVPKKALAQDITGNRVVYGNYVESYNLDIDNVDYKPQISHELTHDPSNLKSVKSLREYQLGVVFTDKYGRETPVLTNNTGTFKVDKNQGVNKNKLQLSLGNTTSPLEMEFFKFYIKQTSGEYYNMAMDRWYDAEDGNVWVSFNSADRNKINDDTVLVLKKGVDSDELVEDPARFKVVAIENEAPDFIKIKKTIISDKAHASGSTATNIFLTGGDLPEEGSTTFSIAYHDNTTHVYSNTVIKDIYNKEQHQGEEFYFQIKNSAGTTSTKPIKIAKINITDEDWDASGGLTKFDIVLEEPFTSLINSFTDDVTGANINEILDDNRAVFWSYKKENRAEFDGRFFVKLFQEDTFKEYVMDNTTAEITQYNTLWDQRVYSFDYGAHNLVWNGASGNMPGGSSYYYTTGSNYGNSPKWDHYIDATDDIAQDGSSGYSTQNWKICAAFFRGINIHKAKDSGTPGWHSYGIDQRQGFDGMDLHGDASSWDFEDVWFLDGAESDGYYSGHWDGSPQTTDHNGIGISGGMLELGFGGIQPERNNGGWDWSYDAGGGSNDTDFYQLHNNKYYDNDSEGSGLASRLTAGVYFRWAEDPTQTVYKITNTADHNLVRHETDQLGGDQRHAALGQPASPYPPYNDIEYETSTFFRPGNHSKNYVLTVSQIDDPNNTTMPWNPYTLGEISGGFVLQITVATGMSSGGNQVTLNTLTAIDVSGFGYGARTLQVGMVCEGLGAIVSKISGTTIYFKNYDSNVANPTYAAVSAGDTLTFKQYGMNGISRNSAKNINYWNSGKGFGAANVGVDAVGYTIEILEPQVTETLFPRFPAIFETEPTEETGLDIYYEMTDNLPVTLNKNNIAYLIPVGSEVAISAQDPAFGYQDGFTVTGTNVYDFSVGSDIVLDAYLSGAPIAVGDEVTITTLEGVKFILLIEGISTTITSPLRTIFTLSPNLTNQKITPTWFNCYSFGNGVESDRVRDLFNKTYISNGVKVSTVLDEKYKEEHKKYSLIYSGIYNSTSGVNNLNQFIAAEKITKDINPIYGSIQKLHSGWGQGGDLIALCEDRVLKILANKDALFNADGSTNITSTNNVLGQAIPYSGEYGISKNPESFASEAYRIYFTDKVRGTVMRLSMDGLTPISNHGMKDWFRDNLKLVRPTDEIIGSYDDYKNEYNLTLFKPDGTPLNQQAVGVDYSKNETITFREDVRGWVSFKSFTPENAISCANEYYTFKNGNIWRHHDETVDANLFYLLPNNSSFTVVLNEMPGSVKSFTSLNYEGSQSRVIPFTTDTTTGLTDGEYYNLTSKLGWYVDSITTDKESGAIDEFIEKEGKWFNYIKGKNIEFDGGTVSMNADGGSTFDQASFAIQGFGILNQSPEILTVYGCTDPSQFNYNPDANVDDGSCQPITNGCVNEPSASNYAIAANTDDGSCIWVGCMDNPCNVTNSFELHPDYATAYNYDLQSSIISLLDDGSCIPAVYGCTITPGTTNYNPLANVQQVSCTNTNDPCIYQVNGCMLNSANNFNPTANTDDGTCTWTGCTAPLATNYIGFPTEASAYVSANNTVYGIQDDGSCLGGGCMDATATNYDATATYDPYPGNGSCIYCALTTAAGGYNGIPVTSTDTADETANGANNGQIAVITNPLAPYLPFTIVLIDSSGNTSFTQTSGQWIGGVPNVNSTLFANLPPDTYSVAIYGNGGASVCSETYTGIVVGTTTVPVYYGCTDSTACNYQFAADATHVDDGSCEFTTCAGCTDPLANYPNSSWTNGTSYQSQTGNPFTDTPQCIIPGTSTPGPCTIECGDGNSATDFGDYCCGYQIYGCTDSTAINFYGTTPGANYDLVDNGTCNYTGCMDPLATNFEPSATIACGSCCNYNPIPGCTDASYCNYDPNATVDDGSCVPSFVSATLGDPNAVDNAGNPLSLPHYFFDGIASASDTAKHVVVGGFPASLPSHLDIGLTIKSTEYGLVGYNSGDKIRFQIREQNPNNLSDFSTIAHGPVNINNLSSQVWHYQVGGAVWGDRTNSPTQYVDAYPFGPGQADSQNHVFEVYIGAALKKYKVEVWSEINGVEYGRRNADGTPGPTPNCGIYDEFVFTPYDRCVAVGSIYGCTDSTACNYDYTATCDDGSCYYGITGGFDCVSSGPPNFTNTCEPVSCGTPQFATLNDCLTGGCGSN